MTFDQGFITNARSDLSDHVQPRDDFERAVVNALGDISWDEAVEAIQKHRAAPTVEAEHG